MTDEKTSRTVEWDASAYYRLSNPHVAWGGPVLDRLPLRGGETVLDAGCGAGRITEDLLQRVPRGHVIALDISENMLAEARTRLTDRYGRQITFQQADLQDFELDQPVDAIFSTAALHWVHDHSRLFRCLFRALKPGGVLVAQCGGGPNIAALLDRAHKLMHADRLAAHFDGWSGPWEFASAELTAERLREAGFTNVETSIEPKPTPMPNAGEYRDYLQNVIFGSHLARIPDPESHAWFLDTLTALAAADDPQYFLDYWRLNLSGSRPVE